MDHLRHYENVGHVLDVLSQMHADISKVIYMLGGQASGARQKMMLGYLADQHSRRAVLLEAYHRGADATLLKQWFQIPFPEDPVDLLASLRALKPGTGIIQELITAIDAFMDQLLPHLQKRAEAENVKALFQNLLDTETQERRLRSRALASFEQI